MALYTRLALHPTTLKPATPRIPQQDLMATVSEMPHATSSHNAHWRNRRDNCKFLPQTPTLYIPSIIFARLLHIFQPSFGISSWGLSLEKLRHLGAFSLHCSAVEEEGCLQRWVPFWH